MDNSKKSPIKKFLEIRGMGAALTAFIGFILIYIVFGLIDSTMFKGLNVLNLLRSSAKYLLIGVAQSYVLITGNIDLSIGAVVGMSAMVAATLMTMGVPPIIAIIITFVACLVIGVINGILVGKFKLPPFIATLGTMFVTRGVAYMVNGGISPLGGTGLLLGTLAGALVWQVLENGLNVIGAQVGIQYIVIGVIVTFAVLLDVVVRNGNFGKGKKKS
ncbi:MAG: hypothetical protein R3Y24_01345 [Eubacteriales bacterium]